jgi:hypothetical protein
MPSYEIERVGDLQEDLVGEYDLALADDQTLFAVHQTSASYLKVSRYKLQPAGDIVRMGSEQLSPQAANLAITAPAASHAVTSAVKIAGGKLVLSQWNPGPSSDADGPSATNSAITSFDSRITVIPPDAKGPGPGTSVKYPQGYLAVTAHSNSTHQLRVTAWLSGDHGIDNLVSTTDAKRTTKVVIAGHASNADDQVFTVITAARADAYKLRLVNWRIRLTKREAPVIERIGEISTNEVISEVAATLFTRSDGDYLATAIIRDEKLAVITWKIESDGSFTRWKEVTAGGASGIGCAHIRRSDIAVGCRDSSNKLRIIYWRFPYSGSGSQEVIRMGTATAGAIGSGVSLVHTSATARNPGDTVAACRTSNGKLKLIRFRLTSGE